VSPVPYVVSLSGSTSSGQSFVSSNSATLTIAPAASISIAPITGSPGQALAVTITGQYTNFLQGSTRANFGAGISVGGAAAGTNGPVTVTSGTSATAQIAIDASAAAGGRNVLVATGVQQALINNGFTIPAPQSGLTVTPASFNFGSVPINKAASQSFTLNNSGQGAVTVTSVTIAGQFFALGNLPSLPMTIQPSGSVSFGATFAPKGTISSSATITVNSDDPGSPGQVSLSGTGTAPALPAAGNLTVATDQRTYRRAQPVQISGSLTDSGGAGIPNIPVSLRVSVGNTNRTLNPYTDASGNYSTTFQPAAADGGAFTVTAGATSAGVTKTATASFRIFGLLLNPQTISQNLAMGSSLAIPLDLQNVGDAVLNNITYTAGVTPVNSVTAAFPQSAATLAAGALTTIPAVLTAPSGSPPNAPVTVLVIITATDVSTGNVDTETSTVTLTLQPALSTLTLTPPSLNVGVNPGKSITRTFAVSNQGFVATSNSLVTLQDPATYNWVSLGNANLGNISSGDTRQFQVTISPPSTLAFGSYTVLFNVSGGTNPLQGTLNISVTQSTLGTVSFVINDDTGAKVNGAAITLLGKTNQKSFQGVSDADGTSQISGVDAGDYTYVVTAPYHDPASGAVTVAANSTTQVSVIMSYEVVNLSFVVTPTTITDQYNVTLKITYSTTLPKPALKVVPYQLNFSFFPEDVPNGQFACSLTVTNTHPTAHVRDIVIDASQLDFNQPFGLGIHVLFAGGSNLYQIGTMAGKQSVSVPCYAVLDGDNVPTHSAGNIIISGNYDYTLDGQILQGTTVTKVPVKYVRPSELEYTSINFTYDALTDPANPVLTYDGGSFLYTLTSERSGKTLNLLKPAGGIFNGHALSAFVQTQTGTTSLNVINANQGNAFWHTDFAPPKQSLLDHGDTATYDISTTDNGLTLLDAVKAQIAVNPRILNLPSYLALEGQWSDRASPTGYLIPIQITALTTDGFAVPWPDLTGLPTGPACLNPEDPRCNFDDTQIGLQQPLPLANNDGQIVIQIDQKLRLERQAFNAALTIGAQATLTNTVVSLSIKDSRGVDASAKFFVLVTGDPMNATKGGTVSGTAGISWQLIPNAGAGGTVAAGAQYTLQMNLSYTAGGVAKAASTQAVTITVLPAPQLTVSYTAPFVVMNGKDAKLRVSITNTGYGTARNFSIQSTQPKIIDTTNPNLLVNFNITGSSNTADGSGFQSGNLTVNFGDVAPEQPLPVIG
jgi:hypothetical protein